MADEGQNKEQPIIIKKIKKNGHAGHHGGAWKVAYADFVTAMMAFFIVMWILASNEEVKEQVAGYFQEPGIFQYETGKNASPVNIQVMNSMKPKTGEGEGDGQTNNSIDGNSFEAKPMEIAFASLDSAGVKQAMEKLRQQAKMDSANASQRIAKMGEELKQQLSSQITKQPELKEILSSVSIEMTKEGLRIELIESKDALFFNVGSAVLSPKANQILKILGEKIASFPNFVEIEGHTDARQYGKNAAYTNWELSNDRANSARRVLSNYFWPGQVERVTGFADRKLRSPHNPFDKNNRRVSILVKQLKTDDFIKNANLEQRNGGK